MWIVSSVSIKSPIEIRRMGRANKRMYRYSSHSAMKIRRQKTEYGYEKGLVVPVRSRECETVNPCLPTNSADTVTKR